MGTSMMVKARKCGSTCSARALSFTLHVLICTTAAAHLLNTHKEQRASHKVKTSLVFHKCALRQKGIGGKQTTPSVCTRLHAGTERTVEGLGSCSSAQTLLAASLTRLDRTRTLLTHCRIQSDSHLLTSLYKVSLPGPLNKACINNLVEVFS